MHCANHTIQHVRTPSCDISPDTRNRGNDIHTRSLDISLDTQNPGNDIHTRRTSSSSPRGWRLPSDVLSRWFPYTTYYRKRLQKATLSSIQSSLHPPWATQLSLYVLWRRGPRNRNQSLNRNWNWNLNRGRNPHLNHVDTAGGRGDQLATLFSMSDFSSCFLFSLNYASESSFHQVIQLFFKWNRNWPYR